MHQRGQGRLPALCSYRITHMAKLQRFFTVALLIVCTMILLLMGYVLYDGGWIFRGADGKDGAPGSDGKDGADGKSAYEIAVSQGFEGSLHDWLVSLAVKGEDGRNGSDGKNGADGKNGVDGKDGVGVADVFVDPEGNLIVVLTDKTTLNAGYVGGEGFVSNKVDADGFTLTYETVVMNDEASSLRLRSTPSTDFDSNVLFYISTGTELLRTGHNHTTGWTRLVYNGTVCYAKDRYFDLKYEYKGDVPEMHLPDSITLTVGQTAYFSVDAILADAKKDFSLGFAYSGSGTRTYDGSNAFLLTPAWKTDATASPHAAEQETLTVTLQTRAEGEWRVIAEKKISVTVVEAKSSLALTGLVIGDSRISDGTLVTRLMGDMPSLTLLGTLSVKSSGVKHEGRGAWSTANYLKSSSVTLPGANSVANAFYNAATGGFDFSYYMQTNYPSQKLDFIVINLGANDDFSKTSAQNINAMVTSIKAYDSSIAVIVMTEYLSPDAGYYLTQSSNLDVAQMRAKQFRYFTYLDELFSSREAEGVHLLPNYLALNDWSDRYRTTVTTADGEREAITDVIHLGRGGYYKEASVLEALLYRLFGA